MNTRNYFEVVTYSEIGRAPSRRETLDLAEAIAFAKETPRAVLVEFTSDGWTVREAHYSPRHPVSECGKFRLTA